MIHRTMRVGITRRAVRALLLAWALAAANQLTSRAYAADLSVTNGYLTVEFPDDFEKLGLFTVLTGPQHFMPDREVLRADYTTSYITFRDTDAKKVWVPDTQARAETIYASGLAGHAVAGLLEPQFNPTLSILGTTGFEVRYDIPNFTLKEEVAILGASTSSYVKHCFTATNVSAASRRIGARFMWDVEAGESYYFRTLSPTTPFTSIFAGYSSPIFKLFQMAEYLAPKLIFGVNGTCSEEIIGLKPTPPGYFRHADWEAFHSTAWDFVSSSGSAGNGAAFYYWGKDTPILIGPGESKEFVQYITAGVYKLTATAFTCPYPLSVSKETDESAVAGETFVYTLSFENESVADAYGVMITDTLPDNLSYVSATAEPAIYGQLLVWRPGTIESGEEWSVDLTVRSVRDGTDYYVESTMEASILGCTSYSASDTIFIYWVPWPADLEIEKSGPAVVNTLDEFDYSIRIWNGGIGASWDVEIIDTLAAGLELVSASGSPDIDENVLTWSLDFLEAGETRELTVRVKAPLTYSTLELENSVQALGWSESESGDLLIGAADSATLIVEFHPPSLSLEKVGPAVAEAGDAVNYKLTVVNEGEGSAHNLILTDTLPSPLCYVSCDLEPERFGQLLVWRVDKLAPGAELSLDLTVRSPREYIETTVTNTAQAVAEVLSEGGVRCPPAISGSTLFICWNPRQAEIKLEKTAPEEVAPEEEFDFTILVENAGTGSAWNLVIIDTLPAELELVSATESPERSGNLLIWRLEALAAGETCRMTARVRGPRSYSDQLVTNKGYLKAWTETLTGICIIAASSQATVLLKKERLETRVFPNPYDRNSAARGTVKFDGIKRGTAVRVYTVRGLKVWEGVVETPYRIEWDGTNESGKPVAPGTYIWIVESEDNKQRGILVVR